MISFDKSSERGLISLARKAAGREGEGDRERIVRRLVMLVSLGVCIPFEITVIHRYPDDSPI
jgi:hypothetical protein